MEHNKQTYWTAYLKELTGFFSWLHPGNHLVLQFNDDFHLVSIDSTKVRYEKGKGGTRILVDIGDSSHVFTSETHGEYTGDMMTGVVNSDLIQSYMVGHHLGRIMIPNFRTFFLPEIIGMETAQQLHQMREDDQQFELLQAHLVDTIPVIDAKLWSFRQNGRNHAIHPYEDNTYCHRDALDLIRTIILHDDRMRGIEKLYDSVDSELAMSLNDRFVNLIMHDGTKIPLDMGIVGDALMTRLEGVYKNRSSLIMEVNEEETKNYLNHTLKQHGY